MLLDATLSLSPGQLLGLTGTQWFVVLTVIFLGGVAMGVGGFGFALVTTPALLWVMPIPIVMVTNLTLSVLLRLPLIYHDRHHLNRPIAKSLIIGGIAGLPVGILLLHQLSPSDIKLYASATIMLLGLPYLVSAQRIPQWHRHVRASAGGVGLVSGMLTTSTSVGGPPVVLWLMNQRVMEREYHGTVSSVALTLNSSGVAVLVGTGSTAMGSLLLPLVLLPIAALGTFLGDRILKHLPIWLFTRIIASLIIVSGFVGVWNAL